MRTYIAKRLLLMIPVMLGVTLITFLLIRVAPGDVVDVIYEEANISQEELDEIRHDLGYDRNIIVQYGDWLWGIVRLDVGESLWTGKPIVGSVVERIPVTVELALMAMVLQVVIALPVGVYAATHQDQVGDQIARFTAILTAVCQASG